MRLVSLLAVLFIATSTALAQSRGAADAQAQAHTHTHDHGDHDGVEMEDASVTLPDVYRVVFENDWVKVTRVHYAPLVKLPAHAHPALPTAFVYLNSSGPVVFRHIGGARGAITRAPTFTGAFRLFRAIRGEVHEVENLAPVASDFLRVELKTEPVEPLTLRGKFLPEPTFDEPLQSVQFENDQIRVTRLYWPRDTRINLAGGPHPSLLVSLTEGEMGRLQWLSAGEGQTLTNAARPAMAALRFEFLSPPIATH